MLPNTMTAISILHAGGPEVLQAGTRPVPQPQAGEVLIEVAYAGVNRHDCGQRARGHGPKGATDIPGLEVSGVVAATGPGVTRWKHGDVVCALVNGGGYAQYCIALEPLVLPIPEGYDSKLAGGLPEALFTAWLNVFMLGGLQRGQWLLVHGGSSGVGTIALQLAGLMGAQAVVTVGNAAKADVCMTLGARAAINYREEDFVARTLEVTSGHGADVILDMVGGAYATRNLQAVAMDGRIVHLSGADAEFRAPLAAIMAKRAVVTGSQLRASSLEFKQRILASLNEHVWPHLGARVRPIVDSVFPLERAADAHAHMESSVHIGKILLQAHA